MKSRWIIAGAAALSLGILRFPCCGGATAAASRPAERGFRGSETPSCDATGVATYDFVLKDQHNVPVKMADFKGKVVIVNFWATWCGPCKIEIPDFVKLYSEYKDKGLVIVGISIDDSPDSFSRS